MAQASHVQISSISDLNGLRLVPVVSSATISEPVMTLANSKVSAMVSLSSPMALEDGDENFVGSEGSGTSVFEGAQVPGPTIRELVGDLDKSWDNSKDWILQLCDGRQLVLPLSLYRSPESMSVCSSLEGECVPGNESYTNEGQRLVGQKRVRG